MVRGRDGTWDEPGPLLNLDISKPIENTILESKNIWREEIDLLLDIYKLRGKKVNASKALEIKRKLLQKRNPKDFSGLRMASAHSEWRLYAALDVYLRLDPKIIFN